MYNYLHNFWTDVQFTLWPGFFIRCETKSRILMSQAVIDCQPLYYLISNPSDHQQLISIYEWAKFILLKEKKITSSFDLRNTIKYLISFWYMNSSRPFFIYFELFKLILHLKHINNSNFNNEHLILFALRFFKVNLFRVFKLRIFHTELVKSEFTLKVNYFGICLYLISR